MNNTIIRLIDVTADYQPLVADRLVATITISCPSDNAGAVIFRGDDGSDVPWRAGEWHTLHRVDLSAIQIKGTVGDTVTVVGGTW
ncbi:MAG: hypothetical protein GX591_00390 [Planctomycetes bacterium]|nr:hypothetical protein [Planctomycetota bacterium]